MRNNSRAPMYATHSPPMTAAPLAARAGFTKMTHPATNIPAPHPKRRERLWGGVAIFRPASLIRSKGSIRSRSDDAPAATSRPMPATMIPSRARIAQVRAPEPSDKTKLNGIVDPSGRDRVRGDHSDQEESCEDQCGARDCHRSSAVRSEQVSEYV